MEQTLSHFLNKLHLLLLLLGCLDYLSPDPHPQCRTKGRFIHVFFHQMQEHCSYTSMDCHNNIQLWFLLRNITYQTQSVHCNFTCPPLYFGFLCEWQNPFGFTRKSPPSIVICWDIWIQNRPLTISDVFFSSLLNCIYRANCLFSTCWKKVGVTGRNQEQSQAWLNCVDALCILQVRQRLTVTTSYIPTWRKRNTFYW